MVYEPRWSRLKAAKAKAAPARSSGQGRRSRPAEEVLLKDISVKVELIVQEMRGRGLSTQAIANALQARKVPRPDGKPWTDNMIITILNRIRLSDRT